MRLGVDIGGTFTDFVLANDQGELVSYKVLSTPSSLSEAVISGIREGFATDILSKLHMFIHSSTVCSNAVIEQKGAKTALITTSGFRDILEIQRENKDWLYDLRYKKPRPLVKRSLRLEVDERIDSKGKVVKPIKSKDIEAVCKILRKESIESVAVCFLFSFVNPAHEASVGKTITKKLPELKICLSSEILPAWKEYERTSTSVTNAYLLPIVDRYVRTLEENLKREGMNARFLIMESNGGMMSTKTAIKKPILMLESGPASGVAAALHLGKVLGFPNIVSFDMGGTTAKMCLVDGGRALISNDYKLNGHAVGIPVTDLVEIGAGGGSIAWIDMGGGLKVGPRSAGADPGPVCYGRGGLEPTITDANVVTGRLISFLGGRLSLDLKSAQESMRKMASTLEMDPVELALGILDITTSSLVQAARVSSVERGYDPRDFALVAFGGAGPLHAASLGAELHVPTIIIPPDPGVTSAIGLLVSDIRHDYLRTRVTLLKSPSELKELDLEFLKMEETARSELASEGFNDEKIVIERSIDLRFFGQTHEFNVPLERTVLQDGKVDELYQRVSAAYTKLFGSSMQGEVIEAVNLLVVSTGVIDKPNLKKFARGTSKPDATAQRTIGDAIFREDKVRAVIFDWNKLEPGNVLEGPAIVEQTNSTILIPPSFTAEVDDYRGIRIDVPRRM